ncbi:branched-chain amino acid ABC transporter permease [Acrocarpospora catenulata]|uniref:branched-chain amino acid ABC transporter permease n=1 Tax=Acrocarpospora catenulata TaxID=2836182 RepID=UPI001BDA136E|nr:branched-chain amino acid ABC transporter permease [Acrocarpospora catenulata]
MDTFFLILATGLSVGALYYLLASGLSLIFGLMDVLSFAHGALLTFSAYSAIMTMNWFGAASTGALLAAIVVSTLVGGAVAFLVEWLFLRPMYARGHLSQLLVTMGIGLVLIAAVTIGFGPDPRSMPLPDNVSGSIDVFGVLIPVSALVTVAAALLLHAGLMAFLRRTRHGLIVRAGVENADMVRGLGIDVAKSFAMVFTIGGLAAGLAGALALVYVRAGTPHLGDTYLIYAFIVIVIGGIGSLPGTLIAAALVGLSQQFANHYLTGGAGDLLVLALLALMLLARPQGLFGKTGRIV